MSDNLSISQGTGTAIAADDVGSVFYQRIKLCFGVDGSAVDASATNPLPVTGTLAVTGTFFQVTQPISAASLPLPSGAATSAKQDTMLTNIGSSSDATVASGVAGSNASYLRTIKDAILDTTTSSPVSVRQPCDVIAVTPTLDTSAYASGDTLFVATAITGAVRAADERALLQSVAVVDKDDQKPALRLVFFKAAVTFGTLNAAPSISDSDAANYLGHVDIAAADYVDLGGVSVACSKGINLLLESASGTTTVYVASYLTAGTPTHTASGLVFNFGVVQS